MLVRRMAGLTDDADYNADETLKNVSSPLSDAGNQDTYYGRRLRIKYILHSLPEQKTQQNEEFETIQSRVLFLACAQQARILKPNSLCRRFCAQPLFVEWDDKFLQHKSDHMNTLFCSNLIWIICQLYL
ncbi:unnamed protein product [Protopolystoma xenopodis]|uniref:Uncharacterized protein n=1 Tax=Protopolystoma xenopodis TaxID=117903 RepID=A0A3S5AZM5_9PLAT|nr:unnamed protein product [Protopolystoma xenopodis]